MKDLDLRKLRYFVVVADELNYGRAAERLHIAQPVLSRQIVALEKELGAVLFERSKRGTRLTEAGSVLKDEAQTVLTAAAALGRRTRVAGRGSRSFTVGFMPGIIVTPAVRLMSQRFPDLQVEVVRTTYDDQIEMIHDGRVDVSLVRLPVPTRGLVVVPLFSEDRVVALPKTHPLAEQATVDLGDLVPLHLLQHPDMLPEWRDAPRGRSSASAAKGDIALPVMRTVEEKLEHVAAERGFVVLPESAAGSYTRPDITYIPLRGVAKSEVAIAFDENRGSTEINTMVEIARAVFENRSDVAIVEERAST